MSERYKILKAKCEWSGDTVWRIVDTNTMEVENIDYGYRSLAPLYLCSAEEYIRIYEEGGDDGERTKYNWRPITLKEMVRLIRQENEEALCGSKT